MFLDRAQPPLTRLEMLRNQLGLIPAGACETHRTELVRCLDGNCRVRQSYVAAAKAQLAETSQPPWRAQAAVLIDLAMVNAEAGRYRRVHSFLEEAANLAYENDPSYELGDHMGTIAEEYLDAAD